MGDTARGGGCEGRKIWARKFAGMAPGRNSSARLEFIAAGGGWWCGGICKPCWGNAGCKWMTRCLE
ncbi:hypothetical protein [Campylobacter sp.]|uniref:hypothetical protein n=1 Tax=Campylobacter sp. TaxID=205 RepID=UPI0026DC1A33|nr:hypothetical protein [Campylobacter sp.]MDO4674863.1 hypothetical protein [Campylobacter sp.]